MPVATLSVTDGVSLFARQSFTQSSVVPAKFAVVQFFVLSPGKTFALGSSISIELGAILPETSPFDGTAARIPAPNTRKPTLNFVSKRPRNGSIFISSLSVRLAQQRPARLT